MLFKLVADFMPIYDNFCFEARPCLIWMKDRRRRFRIMRRAAGLPDRVWLRDVGLNDPIVLTACKSPSESNLSKKSCL